MVLGVGISGQSQHSTCRLPVIPDLRTDKTTVYIVY